MWYREHDVSNPRFCLEILRMDISANLPGAAAALKGNIHPRNEGAPEGAPERAQTSQFHARAIPHAKARGRAGNSSREGARARRREGLFEAHSARFFCCRCSGTGQWTVVSFSFSLFSFFTFTPASTQRRKGAENKERAKGQRQQDSHILFLHRPRRERIQPVPATLATIHD
jgi:hypothetical protein